MAVYIRTIDISWQGDIVSGPGFAYKVSLDFCRLILDPGQSKLWMQVAATAPYLMRHINSVIQSLG